MDHVILLWVRWEQHASDVLTLALCVVSCQKKKKDCCSKDVREWTGEVPGEGRGGGNARYVDPVSCLLVDLLPQQDYRTIV